MVCSTASSSLAAPPEGEDLVVGVSVPDPAAALAIQSVLSDDPGTDLEDELCHFSPLQETISPLSESGDECSDVSVSVFGAAISSITRHGYFCLRDTGVPVANPGW